MARRQPPPKPKTAKQMEPELRALLAQPLADTDLRAQVEALAQEPAFPELLHVWGPALYARNRVLFRPLLQHHLSPSAFGFWSGQRPAWKGELGKALDAWLAAVEAAGDDDLFRSLYGWKISTGQWGTPNEKRWRADLLAAYRAAAARQERNAALARYNLPLTLDEDAALELYRPDPVAARDFILRHLPRDWANDAAQRKPWRKLAAEAHGRGDDDFHFALYRKQVPLKEWQKDALDLCAAVADPAALLAELDRHHPEGWGMDLGGTVHQMVQKRGRDVVPYVLKHIRTLWRGWGGRTGYTKLLELARKQGWLDLWSGLVRFVGTEKEFTGEVNLLVADRKLPDEEVFRRLALIAGPAFEWTEGRVGGSMAHPLPDKTAVALYERYPELIHGPFKGHVSMRNWGANYPQLLMRALTAKDDALVDALAAGALTRDDAAYEKGLKDMLTRLARVFEGAQADPAAFARRAAGVLGQVPPFSVNRWRGPLTDNNPLAKLLLTKPAAYLADPAVLRDLLEAPEITVQIVGLRALGMADDRARQAAAGNVDLLCASLFRPLQRRTRLLLFGAIRNAALSAGQAAVVCRRALEALDLRDRRYPKEQLLGLVGELLHRWPALRGPREHVTVYGGARP